MNASTPYVVPQLLLSDCIQPPPQSPALALPSPHLFFFVVMGPVEAAPEYRVIVDANNLTVEIENELSE